MINEKYYEMTEEKQKEFLRETVLQRVVCSHNPMSEKMLEIFVNDGLKINKLQKELYFAVLKLKPEEMPIEFFDFCFLSRVGFFSATTIEQEALHKVVAKENDKLEILIHYYQIRASVVELAEDFPEIASCLSEVLLDLCKTFDHARCQNCDLCTHKESETFTNFLLSLFEKENSKEIDFSEVRRNWQQIQKRIAFIINSSPEIQLYFHRLVDRISAKAGIVCNVKDCICQLGAETLYKMSLAQKGAKNGLN